MDRKHADPVTRAVPGVTVTGPGNAAPDPVTGPVTGRVTPSPETPAVPGNTAAPVAVVPVPAVVRAGIALRYHARELWLNPGRLLHVLWNGEAETMAEHRVYVESRGWVPAGMSEAAERAVTIAGLVHYLFVARSLKRAMKAVKFAAEKVDHAADRAVSFYIAAAIVIVLIVLLSVYL